MKQSLLLFSFFIAAILTTTAQEPQQDLSIKNNNNCENQNAITKSRGTSGTNDESVLPDLPEDYQITRILATDTCLIAGSKYLFYIKNGEYFDILDEQGNPIEMPKKGSSVLINKIGSTLYAEAQDQKLYYIDLKAKKGSGIVNWEKYGKVPHKKYTDILVLKDDRVIACNDNRIMYYDIDGKEKETALESDKTVHTLGYDEEGQKVYFNYGNQIKALSSQNPTGATNEETIISPDTYPVLNEVKTIIRLQKNITIGKPFSFVGEVEDEQGNNSYTAFTFDDSEENVKQIKSDISSTAINTVIYYRESATDNEYVIITDSEGGISYNVEAQAIPEKLQARNISIAGDTITNETESCIIEFNKKIEESDISIIFIYNASGGSVGTGLTYTVINGNLSIELPELPAEQIYHFEIKPTTGDILSLSDMWFYVKKTITPVTIPQEQITYNSFTSQIIIPYDGDLENITISKSFEGEVEYIVDDESKTVTISLPKKLDLGEHSIHISGNNMEAFTYVFTKPAIQYPIPTGSFPENDTEVSTSDLQTLTKYYTASLPSSISDEQDVTVKVNGIVNSNFKVQVYTDDNQRIEVISPNDFTFEEGTDYDIEIFDFYGTLITSFTFRTETSEIPGTAIEVEAITRNDLYPNPVSGNSAIYLKSLDIDTYVRIITPQGIQVQTEYIKKTGLQLHPALNLRNLTEGLYFIQYNTSKGLHNDQVLVK